MYGGADAGAEVRLSGRRRGIYPRTTSGWVLAHIIQYFTFDAPLLDFEAVEPAGYFGHVAPALDFSFAGAADAVEEVAGLAFGCQQRICVSQEQQQRTLPTRSIFVLNFVSSGVRGCIVDIIALGSSSSTSGICTFLSLLAPLLSSNTSLDTQPTLIPTPFLIPFPSPSGLARFSPCEGSQHPICSHDVSLS